MNKKTAVLIFIDRKENLLLQKRGSYSKGGEKLGYFGGNIDEGEEPKEALIRELKEELNYVPENIKFWKKVDFLIQQRGNIIILKFQSISLLVL